jgi:signal transduction histidine kinase
MEAHGGTLTLESAARVGTRATLTFAHGSLGGQRLLAA